VNSERKSRYIEKIKYVTESLIIVDKLLPNPNEIETSALYYRLLTAIESVMDIIAMSIRDSGGIPKGDNSNIQHLLNEKRIEEDLSFHLLRCNGLRNVLVQQYNGIDREIVLRSVPDVRKSLTDLIDIIEEFLNEA
jgi:uncharacterized protein YutE (UPF0331/DUF86 family)